MHFRKDGVRDYFDWIEREAAIHDGIDLKSDKRMEENMGSLSDYVGGRFLAKEDVPKSIVVRISNAGFEWIGPEDGPKEKKLIIEFHEEVKPMVCNKTNTNILRSLTNAEEPDQLIGTKIQIYNDPTVSFAGKVTGGLRIGMAPITEQDVQQAQDPNQLPF